MVSRMQRLDAIADPVRVRLVRHLEEHPDGATLSDLAAAADVHPNTARLHVAALEAAGILDVEAAPSPEHTRGRPPLRYRLAADWVQPASDFRGMAEVLAAALCRSGATKEDVRAVGEEWGRYLLGRPGQHDPARELPQALERIGFDAACPDATTLTLSACPCRLVSPQRPELICELAVAVAEGVLAGSGSGLTIAERSHDPEARRCSARLRPATTTKKKGRAVATRSR
jgi:predicted ArsR family transcriptional regulator